MAKHSTATEDRGTKKVTQQPHRFAGLFLTPFAGLVASWLIHIYTAGVDFGEIHTPGSTLGTWIVSALIILVAVGLSQLAWLFAEHRKPALRWSLRGSVFLVGALFGVSVLTGPDYIASFTFILAGETVAVIWSMARLNVTRVDPKEGDGTDEKETFFSRIGVSKLTKMSGKVVHDEETGEPVRIDVDVHHAPGETADVFGEGNLGKMESAAKAPPGMASVVQHPDRADKSSFSIPLVDPFKRNIAVGPLSNPGKSIAEWTTVGDYAAKGAARFALAGGIHTPSPVSYLLIGMTRAGKTGTETQMLTEFGSRYDWACLYLNQAKGLQDVRPLLPIIEAAVITDADGDSVNLAPFRVAVENVKKIMRYRQAVLAEFGVSAWMPRCGHPDPAVRPSRPNGTIRKVMPQLPFLTMHVGEADSLLSDNKLGDNTIFIASKALSLGLNVGTSLQKPDFRSMPTNVRSQIGLKFIHGLAESDDEEYLLDKGMREKGATPGKWGQKRPGQHLMIGAGTEHEEWETLPIKTRFLIGSDRDASGRKYTFDELNERYMAEMLRRNFESAKTQAKLDQGSADATEGWWEEQVAKTDALRNRMLFATATEEVATATVRLATATATPSVATSQPQPATATVPPGFRGKPVATATVADDDDEPTAEEMQEMHEEVADITEVEGIELYGDPAIAAIDLTRPAGTAPVFENPEDDPLYDPEEEAKPAPKTRGEALEAMALAFDELLRDETLIDPANPNGGTVVISPGLFYDRYGFRSRPWVQGEFSDLAQGRADKRLADRYDLTLAEDLGAGKGLYRLTRVSPNAA